MNGCNPFGCPYPKPILEETKKNDLVKNAKLKQKKSFKKQKKVKNKNVFFSEKKLKTKKIKNAKIMQTEKNHNMRS